MTRPLALFVALLFVATACASASSALGGPLSDAEDAAGSLAVGYVVKTKPADAGVAVVPQGGAALSATPGSAPFMVAHEGLVFGFQQRQGEWLEVVTSCNDPAWVHEDEVEVTPQSTRGVPGTGFDLGRATVVLDPGHGSRDLGGRGPEGLYEKGVNLDIADRVRRLMLTPHDVDWVTGAVTAGDDVAAFGTVWLTRTPTGPFGGDYEAGLGFRAELANAAGADALVSIHNNTVPQFDTDVPGSEVYYAVGAEGSDRLASLIYDELLTSLAWYSAEWTGGDQLGALARVDPDTGDDYYGLLRRATMPAVIVEGVYISEADQEALLATEEFRQSYAEAVYRGVVRFLTTGAVGDHIFAPEPFGADAGTVASTGCEVPSQP